MISGFRLGADEASLLGCYMP